MTEKLKKLYQSHRETVNYLIFGVLTTLVNWVIYYPLLWIFGKGEGDKSYLWVNVVAWIGAVIFSYIVNKRFVFESKASGAKAVTLEFLSFVASRLFSLLVEEALLWLAVDVLHIGEGIAKICVAVVTVVLNYITGKLVVFRKKK